MSSNDIPFPAGDWFRGRGYASTHDHIGQLYSLLQDWYKGFNEPLVLNLAAYLRSRDWVCAMCIYNFIPCFNAVLSLSDHCCYIVRW